MSTSLRLLAAATAVLTLLLTSACNRPALLLDANQNNLRTARSVASNFYTAYGAQTGIKDEPFITIGMEGGQGYSYDVAHNVLFVTPYSHADFDTQKFFARSSENSEQGERTYNDIMFRFFTAHQLMHLVYDKLPLPHVDLYEEELRINVLTWIFLSKQGLLPTDIDEQLLALERIQEQLGKRFPSIKNGSNTISTLRVDDNASYWYVTAESMISSYQTACTVQNPRAYLNSLQAISLNASATQ